MDGMGRRKEEGGSLGCVGSGSGKGKKRVCGGERGGDGVRRDVRTDRVGEDDGWMDGWGVLLVCFCGVCSDGGASGCGIAGSVIANDGWGDAGRG